MIRLHSGRLFATTLAFAVLLTGVILALPVFAQDETPLSELPVLNEPASPETSPQASPVASPLASPMASPVASPQTSPVAFPQASPESSPQSSQAATPEASPVATEPYETSEFLSGPWRIAVITAEQNVEFPEFELPPRPDKDWMVVIADITNWSRNDERLDPTDFQLLIPGETEPRGFARRSTEGTAGALDLAPEDVEDGVEINAGDTERVVLVFELANNVVNPSLFFDNVSLPLTPAMQGGPPLNDLPDLLQPGQTARQIVDGVVSGGVLALGANAVESALSFVDAPVEDECFAEQSEANLRRVVTERVFVEFNNSNLFVWTEEEDGTRRLLNYEQISGGFAAASPETSGRFALWLIDSEERAKSTSGGLWEVCSGPHGVTRTTAPERTNLRMSDNLNGTTSYRVWLEWSPELVTTPNGGAWALFSALADDGPLQDQQRLYASQYDPTQGAWTDARPMPAGEIQFGASAVVDSKGLVHVVYSAREQTGDEFFSTLLYTMEDGRGDWIDPVAVSLDQLAGHQIAPSLAIDANDRLYVAWQDQRAFGDQGRASSPLNADIFVSQKEPSGAWSTPVIISNHLPTAAALLPRLVVDGDRLVAVWSIYTSALGPDNAARMEWATRAIDAEPVDWSAPQLFANGRGDNFGGRFVDMAADPTGGVVVAYARRGVDTFLFVKRLKPGAAEWGSDTLVAFGDRGSFPTIKVNNDGVVYVAYNANTGTFGDGSGVIVDIGATAISYRSIEPGNEIILTRDDPNSQGRSVVAIDVTGQPWFLFFGEIPGFASTQVGALRNANIPVAPITDTVAPEPEDQVEAEEGNEGEEAEETEAETEE